MALAKGTCADSVSGDLVTFAQWVEMDKIVLQGTTTFTYIPLFFCIQLFPLGFRDQAIKEL